MKDIIFNKKGVKIADSDILDVENKIGVRLPNEYRTFLLETNGGTQPKYCVFNIDDGNSSVLKEFHAINGGTTFSLEKKFRNPYIDPNYIQIGTDSFGNHICLSLKKEEFGSVYFHYHDQGKISDDDLYEPVYLVSHGFNNFIDSLKLRDELPLSEIDQMGEGGTYADLLRFLGNGNSIDKKNKHGRTLAQECARNGNIVLLEKCYFHRADMRGAIFLAFINSRSNVVRYLLSIGVDINERNSEGKTPLDSTFGDSKDFTSEMRQLGAKKSSEL